MMKKRSFVWIIGVMLAGMSVVGQPLSDSELAKKKLYTSLEEALQEPDSVYRLKLKKRLKCDSLPSELFACKNLQELYLMGTKLSVLNQAIGELKNLTLLNLYHNKLVMLPETIGNLSRLRTLIISKNLISTLPKSIGKLQNLTLIDAWDNPLYTLPDEIIALQKTLKILDLRQIALRDYEYDKMVELLPKTNIIITSACNCNNNREK
jgi:Leucine-rich repeat (LRR) protein